MVVLLLIFSGLFHTVFVCLFVFVSFAYAVSSLLWVGFSQLQRVGTTLQLQCMRFSLWTWALACTGFSSCSTQSQQLWRLDSRVWASVVVAHGLSSWGLQAQLPCHMWNHVDQGLNVCSALTGRFLTPRPPRKSSSILFFTVAMPVYILTKSTRGFLFFTFLPTLIFYLFDDSILMGVK